MKSTKVLMNSNPAEETNQACVETVDPAPMQLRGRFDNCTFAKRKVKTYNSITNEEMLQEIKELSELFAFLPENFETCKSNEILKKTEEGRKFQETCFRSAMCTLQIENIHPPRMKLKK